MSSFQGLRSPRNRSLLRVNEDFEGEHNAAIKPRAMVFTPIAEAKQGQGTLVVA